MTNQGVCRSCKAPILWVTMAKSGKANPLDPAPCKEGNIIIRDGKGVTLPKIEREDYGDLYLSHFVTCPNRAQHKKPA